MVCGMLLFYGCTSVNFDAFDYKDTSSYKFENGGIYYWDTNPRDKVEADRTTFVPLSGNYAKDKTHVFYRNEVISNADPETFETLSWYYAKDKNHIYQYEKIVDDVDMKSFIPMKGYFGKDQRHVYCYEKIVKNLNPSTFKIYSDAYIGDDKTILWYGSNCYGEPEMLLNPDIPTFTVLGYTYAKDKQHVYYYSKVMEDADPTTFQHLDFYFDKDKDTVYHFGQKIDGADTASFQPINEMEGKDKNRTYSFTLPE